MLAIVVIYLIAYSAHMSIDLTKYLVDLEQVVCNACQADDTEIFSRLERWGLPITAVICKRCGLMYLNPRPSKTSYQELNRADYRHATAGSDEPNAALFSRQQRHVSLIIIPFLEKYATIPASRSLLDIGCLLGGSMAGWLKRWPHARVQGVEPVEKAGQHARVKTGMPVFTGLFEDFSPGEERYDVVIFAQALNHTLNPRGNFEKIRNLLSPNGLLFISLYDTVSALLNRPMTRMVELTHPYMFCRENIQYLLKVAGFEIIGYEDHLLDAATLSQRDLPGLTFPRIKVVARVSTAAQGTAAPPDYRAILARMRRNSAFYERWQTEITRWHRPHRWRRLVRYMQYLATSS